MYYLVKCITVGLNDYLDLQNEQTQLTMTPTSPRMVAPAISPKLLFTLG